jgi:putative CocE/NonD family hydrolase
MIRKKTGVGAAHIVALLFLCGLLATAPLRSLAQAVAEETKKDAPKFAITAVQAAEFDGRYQDPDEPETVASVYSTGGTVFLNGRRRPAIELTPVAKDKFGAFGAEITFLRDSSGKVAFLVVPGPKKFQRIAGAPERYMFPEYGREEVMIPSRDGIKLHAVILRPKDQKGPLPFLMERTPYGVDGNDSDSLNSRYTELARSGYIFVFEDIRGRFKSEGQFVMCRPLEDHRNPKAIDESTDTYDTVAWLVKNVPNNNGRVGVAGISYPGFLATEAGIDPHPAVKAISPQAPMIDVWLGDDFFHNGAFRETYGYDYVIGMESSKENSFGKLDEDAYDYFLKAGSFDAAGKLAKASQLPTFQGFLEHPSYDAYWQARGVAHTLTALKVPTLDVGGYWDQEDMYGPQEEYKTLEPLDKTGMNFLVLGPWRHGGWGGTTRHLGDVDFVHVTTDEFRELLEAPFFAHYLKDEGEFKLQDTAAYQTGTNEWKYYSHWPPPDAADTALYLGPKGALGFKKPSGKDADSFVSYVSRTGDPVPYRHRPVQATYSDGSKWYTWLVEDQRFVDGRPDVAVWKTEPLKANVTITGNVLADIFASTGGTDSDWVVKLIDVYPDSPDQGKMAGHELMTNMEIFRGRYRESNEHPEATPANAVEEYKFSLHAANHVFLKGHRIMVQIQSTWFPLYDRNPQTYVENIMLAQPGDFKDATQKIYTSAEHPSHVELPVVGKP